jgi:hypothetical protein
MNGRAFPGTVKSRNGTQVAFSKPGDGPPLILVYGKACYPKLGPSTRLATLRAGHFTVFTYDRRGQGCSGDTQRYAAARVSEDLQALIDQARRSAVPLRGPLRRSARAEDAASGTGVKKLVLYEALNREVSP